MKLSNELRVALLALVAAAVFIWGFYFLKGRNLFTHSNTIYVEYPKIEGLAQSALVVINGLRVGTVTDIYLKEDGSGKIMVALSIDKNVFVPKDAIAKIKAPDLMGAKQISLEFIKGCSKAECAAANGDTLRSATANLVESFLGTDIDPLVGKADSALFHVNAILKSVQSGKSTSEVQMSMKEVQAVIHNLKITSDNINKMVGAVDGQLKAVLSNVSGITANLNKNNEVITATLNNASSLTAKMRDLPLGATMTSVNGVVTDVQGTIQKLNATISGLNDVLAKVKNGDGSLGALMNDRKLYDELLVTNLQVQLLTQDIRVNPKRYLNIFSGKAKPQEVPVNDPIMDYIKANPEWWARNRAIIEQMGKK